MPGNCPRSGFPCVGVGDYISELSEAEQEFGAPTDSILADANEELQDYISRRVDDMVLTVLTEINVMELHIIDWFKAFWWMNQRPAMQDQVAMLHTQRVEQARAFSSYLDATETSMAIRDLRAIENRLKREHNPSQQVCIMGTQAYGFGRVNEMGNRLQRAWNDETIVRGTNRRGGPGVAGTRSELPTRVRNFTRYNCDPEANNGTMSCRGTASTQNLDVLVGNTLLGSRTIDMRRPEQRESIEAGLQNLAEPFVLPPVASTASTVDGQTAMLARRSYIARRQVVHNILNSLAARRMPGSSRTLRTTLDQLRQDSGLPRTPSASYGPSYEEAMQLLAEDRFLGGKYAGKLLDSKENVERERLMLTAQHLMRMRDYYENLEKIALTLAVQVNFMVDEQYLGSAGAMGAEQ